MERPVGVRVEIAPGELFDKLSILEIKTERIQDPEKLRQVQAEYESLLASRDLHLSASRKLDTLVSGLDALIAELRAVNASLWEIEDRLRVHERDEDFGEDFIRLARSVYRTNDRRAEIKRQINLMLKSDIVEAKSYESY